MGSECQRSPPVLRCQLASQVHLWGQTANQNKGKPATLFVAAQQTSSASRKLVSRKSPYLERAENNIFPRLSTSGRKLWLVDRCQSDIPGSGCKRVREVILPLSLSYPFFSPSTLEIKVAFMQNACEYMQVSCCALERSAASLLAGGRLLAHNIRWRIKRAHHALGSLVKCHY